MNKKKYPTFEEQVAKLQEWKDMNSADYTLRVAELINIIMERLGLSVESHDNLALASLAREIRDLTVDLIADDIRGPNPATEPYDVGTVKHIESFRTCPRVNSELEREAAQLLSQVKRADERDAINTLQHLIKAAKRAGQSADGTGDVKITIKNASDTDRAEIEKFRASLPGRYPRQPTVSTGVMGQPLPVGMKDL